MSSALGSRQPAIAYGLPLEVPSGVPRSVTAAIANRIAQRPGGVIRTYSLDGNDRAQSYEELWRRSASIATGLRKVCGHSANIVVLLIEDVVDFVPAFWACIRGGFVAVPLMSAAREALHKSRSGSLQAALARLSDIIILVDQKFAELGSELLRDSGLPVFSLADVHTETRDPCDDCFAADPLYLVPSSGSTGRLKLVAVREETLLQRSFVKDFGKQHHELGTFALDSISGQNGVFVRCGSLTQMPVGALTTNPLSVLDAIEKYQISMASFTNSSIKRIIAAADQTNSSWQLTSLRQVGLGGETVVRELVARFAKFLERHGAPRGIIQAHYGTTETGSLVSGANPLRPSTDGHNAVCLGGCAPGVGLRIVGSDGELLPDGEIGNLQAICPQTIFSCYWGEPEQTRDCFTPDGWWKTGDLGCLHNGELSIHGRIKEVIVIEGKKLSLTKIDEEIETILDFGDRAFSCAVAWPGESAERLAVVFVPSTQHSIERFAQHADNIRDHIARRFGFRPYPVLVASLDEIPFANNGKLRRLDLASYIRSGSIGRVLRRMEPAKPNPLTASAQLETILEKLWREALDVRGPLDRQASFFDLGGDSLRSVMLHTAIEEHLNARVSAEAFFRSPTFDNLFQLIALRSKVASTTGTRDFSVPWPLGEDIRDKLLISFELWAGSRPTQDRLVAGLNTTGKKAPLFWVFQEAREFRQLAKSLGRDHPLYGFRSGIGVIKCEEDEIQAIALRYVSEITEVCPEGPVFVGGTCQGAVIALAIAQHLIRRKRHVPLLVLLEWGFPLEYYPGSVLLIYGRDSIEGNPYVRFRNPELGWTRVFGQYAVAEMPGDHGHLSEDCNVAVLAKTLIQHMERTERSPPKFVSEIGKQISVHADTLPEDMITGTQKEILITLRNRSSIHLPGWDKSGLALANLWQNKEGEIITWKDGRSRVPDLPPGKETRLRLRVTAPSLCNNAWLLVTLVEEGNTYIYLPQDAPVRSLIRISNQTNTLEALRCGMKRSWKRMMDACWPG